MRLKPLLAAVLLCLPALGNAQQAPALQGEQLFVLPPQGWVPAFHDTQGNVELVELVPQGQTMSTWTEMLMVQLVNGKPSQTPEEVLKNQQEQVKQLCEDSGFGPVGSAKENGYDTAIQAMACTKSKKYGKGELNLFKVVRGNERLYILNRAWRGDPFDKAHLPVPPETTKAWLSFMQQATVCDSRDGQRPCPKK
ncbi:MAG TPA: hypothetical protein VM661_07225 [Candidatus Sulfotelmatobacter sp.]|jgi:hypothetical protein|nr:hypothetical protein [Candidatus Sulfotelmatobacter sp.]